MLAKKLEGCFKKRKALPGLTTPRPQVFHCFFLQNLNVFPGENDFLVKLAKDLRERVDESKESGALSKFSIYSDTPQ